MRRAHWPRVGDHDASRPNPKAFCIHQQIGAICVGVCSTVCASHLIIFWLGERTLTPTPQPRQRWRAMRQQIIEKALAEIAGEHPDPTAVAHATVGALRLLHAELGSAIGSQATGALYARSVHLTRPAFQWLTQTAADPPEARLAALQDDLSAREPSEARKAGEALLLTFADLLVSLIGEPLTHRLLSSAWGRPADNEPSGRKLDE